MPHHAAMRRMAFVPLLALLLVLPPPAGAASEGTASSWSTILTIDSALAQPAKMFEAFDTASLNLYDFDGDGQLEIVSHNDNNRAYVIDSRTGKVLAEIETYHYNSSRWPIRTLNPIAIGNLYGDGVPCLVIANDASYMSAWCFNGGASSATKFVFDKKWEILVDASKYEANFKETHPWIYYPNGTMRPEYSRGLDGNPYLADVDGDGKMEIFVETDGFPGQFAFNADGSYRWSKSFWDGNAGAKVLDIDKDGVKEAVFASDAGVISSYNAKTGGIEWVFESSKNGASPGSVPVPPLVVDLHGDGHYETIFGTRNVYPDQSNPNWINMSHARYFALDSKGRILWNVSYEWMNPLQYNHPAPVDVNGDGVLDVVFLDWNTIGHKPGNWNTTNRSANLFVLNGKDGSPIWHKGIPVYWSNKDVVIADADGDGKQDIIAPTARNGGDGLGIYDLYTGERKGWIGTQWQLSRGPVAGNLYGDGKLYLVVPISHKITDRPNYRSVDVGYREGALVIVQTNVAYNVAFSGNFWLNDQQKESQVQGTVGTPPPTPTQPTPTTIPTAPPSPTPEPTPTSPTPASPTPTATPTAPTPSPSPTPAPTATPTATPSPTPSPTGNVSATPTTEATPSPTESAAPTNGGTNVPGPGLALVAAAAAAAVVLARKRR